MAEQRPAASPGEPGIIVLSYSKIQDAPSRSVWHRSVCRPHAVKVVAETDGIHHLVDAGVAGHLAGIREVEVAGAETNLPIVRETKLRAHARLKRKIQIGAIGREGLLCVSDNAALDSEIGLQHLAVAPEHAEADRRDRETGYRGEVVAQGIAVFVLKRRADAGG